MKLYLGAGVITATYALVLTSLVTTEPSSLLWNGVVGFMLSLSLVLSLVPAAGPLLYTTATNVMLSALNPRIDLSLLVLVLRATSWALNILFTLSLVLYALQFKRRIARKVIKILLF
ncbi:MAG: hypothetical protein JHC20_04625 [Pyrobaculum sp.]|nr:hypothetical protein [Pyrobaculum sp.]